MRIFIAGGLGFTGSHLCDALKAAGHHVTVFDNQCQSTVAPKDSTADVVHLADLSELSRYNRERYDYMFHCASPAGPARIAPGYALRQIIEGTVQGLDFAQRVGARFIKFSSSECYGRADVGLAEDIPALVNPAYDARSEYQLGFLTAECLCFNHPWPQVQVLRLFNVVGPRQRPESGCVLPRFCQQAVRGEPLTLYQGGMQRRTFTDVSDLAAFCLLLMKKWPAEKGIWNVANPANETSIFGLAMQFQRLYCDFDLKRWDGLGPNYRDGVEKRAVDISKAQALGWQPRVGLQEIINKCMAWAREQSVAVG